MSQQLNTTTIGIDVGTLSASDTTFRVAIHYSGLSSTYTASKIMLKLGYAGSNSYTVGKCYFGRSAANELGNLYDFQSTPTQVTFNGGSASVSVSADVYSDAVTFAYVPGTIYLVSIYLSAGTNYAHKDATTFTWADSYAKSGDVASDLSFGTPDTTYADLIYIIEGLFENNGLPFDKDLLNFELVAGTPPSLLSTMPDLQISASMMDRIWADLPLNLLAFEITGEFGHRLNLEEDLLSFELEAFPGAQADDEGVLPFLECSASMLSGSSATLSERLSFPVLVTQIASRFEAQLLNFDLDIEMSHTSLGGVDLDLAILLISASGGRVGAGSVDRTLFAFDLDASSGAKQGQLSKAFLALNLVAHAGIPTGLTEELLKVTIAATGRPIADLGVDAGLPGIKCAATGSEHRATVSTQLLNFNITATGGTAKQIDADLFVLELAATARRAGHGVDADLFMLDLSTTVVCRTGTLSADLPYFEIAATGGKPSSLDATLSHWELSACGHAARVGVSSALFFPDLAATGSSRRIRLDTNLSIPELLAHGGAAPSLDLDLFILQVAATAHGMDIGLSKPMFMLDIAATGTDKKTVLDRDLLRIRLAATATGGMAALDRVLFWMRMDANLVAGLAADLDAYLSVPSLESFLVETPLIVLDQDLGTLLMSAEVNGPDDVTIPGAILSDPTRWSATVLRYWRWASNG